MMDTPFGLKGDILGMSLDDFKKYHCRWIEGHNEPAPWCSDTRPGDAISELMSEPHFASTGLVNCRLDFPFEQIQGTIAPSVAGVQTQLLIYHFVDKLLYQISAAFDAQETAAIRDALVARYGEPQSTENARWSWSNGVSAISLRKGKRLNQWSSDPTVLIFVHYELNQIAESRKPGPAVHDL